MPLPNYNKTRIAPTPSGYLHLGNVLSFTITADLARRANAKLLLRIDDLDQARVNEAYLQDIFDTLCFLDIKWDDDPNDISRFNDEYSQIHRMGSYKRALKTLHDNGYVFACTCSRKQISNNEPCNCLSRQLPLDTQDACWRLITDDTRMLTVNDINGQITNATLPAGMHHFVVRKKDGFPAYQLTSVVDDLYYGIDLIVRGEDLWPSTLAQHTLAAVLGEDDFGRIAFHHHPLLMEPSGQKLSKSAGATSVKYLRENGKSAADIYTLIAEMLGIHKHVANWQQLAELIA